MNDSEMSSVLRFAVVVKLGWQSFRFFLIFLS